MQLVINTFESTLIPIRRKHIPWQTIQFISKPITRVSGHIYMVIYKFTYYRFILMIIFNPLNMSSFYNVLPSDVSWDQLPLRIPPDLREHVAKHQRHSIRHLLNKREDSADQPILARTFNVDGSKIRYYRYIYKLLDNKMEMKVIIMVQKCSFLV